MSDFNQDMKEAEVIFDTWANSHTITDRDFGLIEELLKRHGDIRSELFLNMLHGLEPSTAEMSSDWEKFCDKALELLDHLNSGIPSSAGGCLRAIGLENFYEGEKKIWQENRKADIAYTAETITLVGKQDEELIDKLQKELKEAQGSLTQAVEQYRQSLGDQHRSTRELATSVVENLIDLGVDKLDEKLVGPLKKILPPLEKFGEKTGTTRRERKDFSNKVAAYKKILLDNMQMLDAVKSKMGPALIESLRSNGEKYASSLKEGRTGAYNAADWSAFGDECARSLRTRSEKASEKAKFLYDDVLPIYKDAVTKSLADLVFNNSDLVRLRGQMDDECLRIFEALRKDDEIIAAVHNNAEKGLAVTMLREIQQKIDEKVKELKKTSDESDENDRS